MGTRERLAEATFDSVEAMMEAYAQEAIRLAWADHRHRLDYSESSVDALEQILEGQSAEDLEFQTRLWGSYFGEMIRARFGGEWELSQYPGETTASEQGPPKLVPAVMVRGSRLYPLLKVYRRLTLGPAENLATFYRMAAARLAKADLIQ